MSNGKAKKKASKKKKKGTKKSKKETTITMDTAKPKGGKWQATLKIEEGSSKLTVKMPFNKSSSSEEAELKDVPKAQKQKGNKNVQQNKDDNKKKNNKHKNEQDPEDAQSASQQVNKKQKVVPQESNASKPEEKSKFTEESNAHPKPSKVTKGQVTAESKQTKPKGYQMPQILGEHIVDDLFTRHHDNSFSHFLKRLNESEASVVHEMLVGKGNLSGSSGQFSDVTESMGNLVEADGCLEKSRSKVENKDSGTKTEKTVPNKKDIESQKLKTPERKLIKEEQKSENESVKTPDSKKKKKNNDSPRSPIDECKNIKVCLEMCRKKNCPELNKGASYGSAMRLKNKSLKKNCLTMMKMQTVLMRITLCLKSSLNLRRVL